MQEQAMVTDALNSINAGLKSLGDMISQTDNQQLRQTLQQMRNNAETCQYELYSIAKSKNYYQPAPKASQEEIMTVKNFVNQVGSHSQSMGQSQGMSSQSMGQSQGMSSQSMGQSQSTSSQSWGQSQGSSSHGMGSQGRS